MKNRTADRFNAGPYALGERVRYKGERVAAYTGLTGTLTDVFPDRGYNFEPDAGEYRGCRIYVKANVVEPTGEPRVNLTPVPAPKPVATPAERKTRVTKALADKRMNAAQKAWQTRRNAAKAVAA